MVGELVDLRGTRRGRQPMWSPPVVAIYGERGAAHHRSGTEDLRRELADVRIVAVEAAVTSVRTHAQAVAAAIATWRHALVIPDTMSTAATPTQRLRVAEP